MNNSAIIGNHGNGFYATFEGILRPDWDYDVVYPRWRYVYQRHNWNQETQIAKTKFYDNENHAIEIGKYCRYTTTTTTTTTMATTAKMMMVLILKMMMMMMMITMIIDDNN